jgi:hypothetical protein
MTFRILLIEDEPGLLMTISDLLTAEGMKSNSRPTETPVCAPLWNSASI